MLEVDTVSAAATGGLAVAGGGGGGGGAELGKPPGAGAGLGIATGAGAGVGMARGAGAGRGAALAWLDDAGHLSVKTSTRQISHVNSQTHQIKLVVHCNSKLNQCNRLVVLTLNAIRVRFELWRILCAFGQAE